MTRQHYNSFIDRVESILKNLSRCAAGEPVAEGVKPTYLALEELLDYVAITFLSHYNPETVYCQPISFA